MKTNYLQTRFEQLKSNGFIQKAYCSHRKDFFQYGFPINSGHITEHNEVFAVAEGCVVFSREKRVTVWSEEDIAVMAKWSVPGPFGVLEIMLDSEGQTENDLWLDLTLFPHNDQKTSWGVSYALPFPPYDVFHSFMGGNNAHHHIILTPMDPDFGKILMDDDWFQNRRMNLRAGYVDNDAQFEVVFSDTVPGVETLKKLLLGSDGSKIKNPWAYFSSRFGIEYNLLQQTF